ncbi:MAG: hypothetical protein ACK6EB_45325, partial [Planctomyces sp.]
MSEGTAGEDQSVLPTRDPRQRPRYELCFALRNGSVEKAQTYQVGRGAVKWLCCTAAMLVREDGDDVDIVA